MTRPLAAAPGPLAPPPLPYDDWEPTKNTLHLICQIVGKTRLRAHPKLNHWWHVPLYVTPRGLTTGTVPYGPGRAFEVELDLRSHEVRIRTSEGEGDVFAIPGRSVAGFYQRFERGLARLGVEVPILARPYEHPESKIPFPEDTIHDAWDRDAVERYHRALLFVDGAFRELAGRSFAKTTPVHLYWHSFDLAVTRFSGRWAPRRDGTRSDKEAYSHEVISFGFWPGDPKVRMPAFYSYTYPEPPGLAAQPLAPEGQAWWEGDDGGHMALLRYDDVRSAADPREALLAFAESAWEAGGRCAEWPMDELDTRPFWAALDREG